MHRLTLLGLAFTVAPLSAQTAPAPSIQLPPYVDEALSTRSNRMLALVGAPGTNARYAG